MRSGPRSPCRGAAATTSRSTTRSRRPQPGDVIVLAVGGERQVAHCGEIVATRGAGARGRRARARRRDPRPRPRSRSSGSPSSSSAPRRAGPGKSGPGALGVPVELDGVHDPSPATSCAPTPTVSRSSPRPTAPPSRPRRARSRPGSRRSSPRSARGDDDRRHLRPEGAPVKITRIEATPLAIPLAQEFHWAGGAQVGANLVLFTVHTDEGVTGYGESICEDQRAVVAYGELMARQLVGRSPGEMSRRSCARSGPRGAGRCSRSSRSSCSSPGIEVACWDALGRALGVPTRTFFGGGVQEELDYFGFLQGDDPETARGPRARARGRGLPGHLPQGRPRGRARRRLRRRRSRGDRARAACCGSTRTRPGTRATAVDRIRLLEQYDLDWVEQPTPAGDVNGLAHVRRSVERQDRRRPGRVHDEPAPARAREGGRRRRRPGKPRRGRAAALPPAGVRLRRARAQASTATRSWRARSASTRTPRSPRRSRT